MRSVMGAGICGAAVILAAGGAGAAPADDEAGFVPIFDGRTMTGWDVFHIAPERPLPRPDPFAIEDGAFYCKGYKDYWLRYKARKLDNFVLRLQYRLTKGANSGVCIHTQDTGIPWQTGFEVQLLDDHGKDPDVHTSGAIYDVVTPMYNASKPLGEWNDLEITCRGRVVQVAVNGLKLIDTDFGMLTAPRGKFKTPYAQLPTTGYITFQDHGMPLWLRNLRVKKLEAGAPASQPASRRGAEEGFETIFDGASAAGWAVFNPEGGAAPAEAFVLMEDFVRCLGKGAGFWRYEKAPLDDFVLSLEYRVRKGTNSGIVLRSPKTGNPCYSGFEVQVLDDHGQAPGRHSCGAIYDVVTPMYNVSKPAGEWNAFEITVDGSLVTVVHNGWKVIDTDFSRLTAPRGKFNFPYSEMPRAGYLCLQDHGGVVDYRNIRVKPIRH